MPSFEETIARMKGLYTYGKELNEGNDLKSHTLEYHAIAADGKSYGIVRECNKYYIKTAPKSKEMVAEAYDYIGGFCNKGSYEYKSYANALKQFELKLASINEAYEGDVNISTLNPFKKNEFLVEGTQKMQDEIARCRQIMYNASMIMNESRDTIGATKKDDVVKYNGTQPEAENGKTGAEGYKEVGKVDGEKNPSAGKSGNKPGKDGVFTEKPSNCSDQLKEGVCQKCGKEQCVCNEESGDIGDNPLMPNTENWGTEGIGKGRDPQSIGWEMDGQKRVNEEENDWASKGLPSSPGVGDANTSKNNDPFNKSINEEDEDFDDNDVEDDNTDTLSNNDADFEPGDENTEDFGEEGEGSEDTDFDAGLDDEFSDEDFSDEEDEFGDEDFGENDDEFGGEEDEDLRSEIEDLKAQIEALKAQINGENEEDSSDFGDEFADGEDGEFGSDDEFGGDEMGGSEEMGGDDEFGGDEMGGSDEMGGDDEFGDDEMSGDNEFGPDNEFGGEDGEDYSTEDETGEEPERLQENRRRLNKIVESVVKKVIKEEELHVFGKHPGYRKKPMELPTTGEDKNQWGEDWNDESVHNEEPFGSKIGNGDPFNELVNAITKDVMYQLKAGIPIEGKKKED